MKSNPFRALASWIASAIVFAVFPLQAMAAGYPEKPITIIVPYPPGGVTDLAARAVAVGLGEELSQSVVVMNKSGAGATIGGNAVASAAPDGYTIGFFPIAASIPEVFRFVYTAPYKSTDLAVISGVAATAMSFAVQADSPLKSMKDVVELARKNKGLLIGTPGKQTLPSMIMVEISAKEGVSLEDVPFGGDSKTVPALVGGHVPVGAADFAALKAYVDSGRLRLLAVCTESRIDLAPDVPTVTELGYKLPYVSSFGMFGPKGMPKEIVQKLDAVIAKVAKDPKFIDRMRSIAIQVAYKDTATYQQAVVRDRANLEAFFTQQGLYK